MNTQHMYHRLYTLCSDWTNVTPTHKYNHSTPTVTDHSSLEGRTVQGPDNSTHKVNIDTEVGVDIRVDVDARIDVDTRMNIDVRANIDAKTDVDVRKDTDIISTAQSYK